MARVLVLVIASFNNPAYTKMKEIWERRCIPDMWFIRCKPASQWIGDLFDDASSPNSMFELDVENRTLFVKGDECLIPGILSKTVEAISFFFLHRKEVYDYVWRTNLSSVLDVNGLLSFVNKIDVDKGVYGGCIGKEPSTNILFASGAGFLMSRDVALNLVENKSQLRYDLIDDVAIGALLEPRFGILRIDRCWVQTGGEDIKNLVLNEGIFHFRCESYQHLRTAEFMEFVSASLFFIK
jgi:hypothetical protein